MSIKNVLLSGHIQFSDHLPAEGVPVHVKVLDTSLSDIPAITIAETVITFHKKTLSPAKQLPFQLELPATIDPSATYTLAVHVDVDKDGTLSSKDYIHRQSYPVITYGNKITDLTIELRMI